MLEDQEVRQGLGRCNPLGTQSPGGRREWMDGENGKERKLKMLTRPKKPKLTRKVQ